MRGRPVDVVIDPMFGDGGKGRTVDWLCSSPAQLVVRFSGGPQAGHTVATLEGKRHVFRTYGSGTLRGCPTFLSRFMCVDPVAMVRERRQLVGLGVKPVITIDPAAPVITPYDVLLNRLTEESRGRLRHGSCGAGVGECMRRLEETPHRLTAGDLTAPKSVLESKLHPIYVEFWEQVVERALLKGGAEAVIDDCLRTTDDFLAAVTALAPHVTVGGMPLKDADRLVFEGSQGVLLDREIGVFPHVTRAKTGLVNVRALIGDDLLRSARVFFVTRCYVTRHGAGPLDGEMSREMLGVPPCETNTDNEWQGGLRYGAYDSGLRKWAMDRALWEVDGLVDRVVRVTTCLDQLPEEGIRSVKDGLLDMDHFRLVSDVLMSGPTREDTEWQRLT